MTIVAFINILWPYQHMNNQLIFFISYTEGGVKMKVPFSESETIPSFSGSRDHAKFPYPEEGIDIFQGFEVIYSWTNDGLPE